MSQTATRVHSTTPSATHVNGRPPLVLIADGNTVSQSFAKPSSKLPVSVCR